MTQNFDPDKGAILVPAHIAGPKGRDEIELLLDTGCTWTVLRPSVLASLKYDLSQPLRRLSATTASGNVDVDIFQLESLSTLGKQCSPYFVAVRDLPAESPGDGLLGLDFFEGHLLQIDFRQSTVTLT